MRAFGLRKTVDESINVGISRTVLDPFYFYDSQIIALENPNTWKEILWSWREQTLQASFAA